VKGAAPDAAAAPAGREAARGETLRGERLGIVSYTNVAPLHWRMEPWEGASFVHGVPTELNARLLDGDIDLTLVSSVEFVRHRAVLRALPDFSIATLGAVQSVMLFHRAPWSDLSGASVAVTTDSATSVALLETLLREDGISTRFVPHAPDLDEMLRHHDAALLIGDVALEESVSARAVRGAVPLRTDLGEAWYRSTNLPFTFAVWAAHVERPPSPRLVAELRAARSRGLGHLAAVATEAAEALRLSPEVLLRYLANFRYFLDPADRRGLEAFAARVDPAFTPDELRYWPS
jgi:chorismate dehydratase